MSIKTQSYVSTLKIINNAKKKKCHSDSYVFITVPLDVTPHFIIPVAKFASDSVSWNFSQHSLEFLFADLSHNASLYYLWHVSFHSPFGLFLPFWQFFFSNLCLFHFDLPSSHCLSHVSLSFFCCRYSLHLCSLLSFFRFTFFFFCGTTVLIFYLIYRFVWYFHFLSYKMVTMMQNVNAFFRWNRIKSSPTPFRLFDSDAL